MGVFGHEQPFDLPSKFQAPDSAECPVFGERFNP